MRIVKPERTGWRDLELNNRHRKWGYDCPAADVDLFVEYDHRVPKGIVEYKRETAPKCNGDDANRCALCNLADMAGLPFFGCRYTVDFTNWHAVPGNARARQYLHEPKDFTEYEWVHFLYRLRGRPIPEDVQRLFGPNAVLL